MLQHMLSQNIMRAIFALICLGVLSAPAHAYSEREGLDIYQRGHYADAVAYWTKAAKAGDAGSAYRLGTVYLDATVVKRDIGLAVRYLKQAAAANDARALTDMAALYEYGQGVRRDINKAANYYLRAARMGQAAAMFNAASFLERGEGGLKRDRVEAYKFYLLASDLGFAPFARSALAELGAQMTADEIAQATTRAENFIPK